MFASYHAAFSSECFALFLIFHCLPDSCLQDLHQEIGTQLESENEQQFVTFSRYMGALETGLDNTVKFLKRKQRGQAATEPSIYPGRARESKIKEVK